MPLGLGAAIYLSEYAAPRMRGILKPALEVLAGIPTVVFGYFALTFVTPLLRDIGIQVDIFNALSAGLVMGVMLIPTVASLSEDAMAAVPRDLRDGAYALGATKLQVSTRIVVPGRPLGHRRLVRARDLARRRRDDDRADRGGPAAEPDLRPARGGRDDDGVHRRDRRRRRADRVDRVQDDLRRRRDAVRADVRHEHRSRSGSCGSTGRSTNDAVAPLQGARDRSRALLASSRLASSASSRSARCSSTSSATACRYLDLTLLTEPAVDRPEIRPARGRRSWRRSTSASCCSSSPSRSASAPRSTSRSTRTRRAGTTACSRSTSRTSPRCRRSSTASSGSRSSCAGLGLGRVLLAGALILTLLVLPTVIIASREAIRAVPDSIRQGGSRSARRSGR